MVCKYRLNQTNLIATRCSKRHLKNILEYGKSRPNYYSAFTFSLFPTMISTQSWTEIIILETPNLMSAIAFNSVQRKILSFGKKLNEIKAY